MHNVGWEAAVAHATALETQLRQAQSAPVQDPQLIAHLTAQLQAARAELARLQSGMPQPMYAPPMGYSPYGYASFMYPSRGSTILVFGILGLLVCAIFGPIAWSMGNEELRRIEAGQAPPDGHGSAQAGRICGMISSILMICMLVFVVFVFIMAAGSSHSSSGGY
jgi:hypothetical protein